jgi:mannose-6-phosphate isomerase-like protein (cupin superfamily)
MTLTRTNTTERKDSGASLLSLSNLSSSNPANKLQEVCLTYPSADNDYRISVAVVPAGSKWHAGAHWHEEYDELMRVVKGRAKIRLGNDHRVITAEDGEVLIKKGVVHDVMRADVGAKEGEGDEGDLWLEERSEPGNLSVLTLTLLRLIGPCDGQSMAQKNFFSGTCSPRWRTRISTVGSIHSSCSL